MLDDGRSLGSIAAFHRAIHRGDYQTVLLEEAMNSGVNMLTNAEVIGVRDDRTLWKQIISLKDGREIVTDVVVGADGQDLVMAIGLEKMLTTDDRPLVNASRVRARSAVHATRDRGPGLPRHFHTRAAGGFQRRRHRQAHPGIECAGLVGPQSACCLLSPPQPHGVQSCSSVSGLHRGP
jgi:hypothetical protein